MNKKTHYQTVTVPTLFITKDRQRVKQNNNTVYLNDGEEFELELYNPRTNKVLAKISLNDNELGSGIVLRPGERVYLERYIDEARKFIFETYQVDKNDPNSERAIKNNGKVEVEFHDEDLGNNMWVTNDYRFRYCGPPNYDPPVWHQDPGFYYGNTTEDVIGYSDDNASLTSDVQSVFSCSTNSVRSSKNVEPELKETGRIEMGSGSNQILEYDNSKFNSFSSWSCKWQIKPLSQKAYVKEELKIYCTGCGAKRKKSSHQFCPNCGQKF